MDYSEMLFAYFVRKEVTERIMRNTQGQDLTKEEAEVLLDEYILESVQSIREMADRIRNIPS